MNKIYVVLIVIINLQLLNKLRFKYSKEWQFWIKLRLYILICLKISQSTGSFALWQWGYVIWSKQIKALWHLGRLLKGQDAKWDQMATTSPFSFQFKMVWTHPVSECITTYWCVLEEGHLDSQLFLKLNYVI